jgi:hypothetical protein
MNAAPSPTGEVGAQDSDAGFPLVIACRRRWIRCWVCGIEVEANQITGHVRSAHTEKRP